MAVTTIFTAVVEWIEIFAIISTRHLNCFQSAIPRTGPPPATPPSTGPPLCPTIPTASNISSHWGQTQTQTGNSVDWSVIKKTLITISYFLKKLWPGFQSLNSASSVLFNNWFPLNYVPVLSACSFFSLTCAGTPLEWGKQLGWISVADRVGRGRIIQDRGKCKRERRERERGRRVFTNIFCPGSSSTLKTEICMALTRNR